MKIINLINNCLFQQYELRVENYLFDANKLQFFVVFKPRFSRCKLKISLNEILINQNYIKKIHPYDCYIIGILKRLNFENIIPKNKLPRIKHNNEKLNACLNFVGVNYSSSSLIFEIANSVTKYNITIHDFLKNTFIIRGLTSIDSFKLGFIVTDNLISREI